MSVNRHDMVGLWLLYFWLLRYVPDKVWVGRTDGQTDAGVLKPYPQPEMLKQTFSDKNIQRHTELPTFGFDEQLL